MKEKGILYGVQGNAKTKRTAKGQLRPIICHVAYGDAQKHREIVEKEFQWHGLLDVEYVRTHHPDHFSEPHNVSRAILRYRYFRNRGLFFVDDDGRYAHIAESDLPSRTPDN